MQKQFVKITIRIQKPMANASVHPSDSWRQIQVGFRFIGKESDFLYLKKLLVENLLLSKTNKRWVFPLKMLCFVVKQLNIFWKEIIVKLKLGDTQ